MPAIQYRPVHEAEIPETVTLFLTAVEDLYTRHGMGSSLPSREMIETNYRHIFQTGIFYVAEIDGEIGAICHAIVRDELWFLSGFWALPRLQQQKIGGPLLKQVWDGGERAGARTFFVWSSSDITALASYMKRGMLPGYQIFTFAGTPDTIPDKLSGFEVKPLSVSSAVSLDHHIRATGREVDHRFWLSQSAYHGYQVQYGDQITGYFYTNGGGIGPAGWIDPQYAQTLMTLACRHAANQSEPARMLVPGINHEAIRFALRAGLRLTGMSHFLTTAPFGHMDQYLTSGPSLF